jgi:glucose-6-phosphate 1-dehydrogenase
MSDQGLKVDCTGMAHSTPPAPCVVVIFGVAGDLGRTTLVPSLYALAGQKLLPEPCAILGVARRDWDSVRASNMYRLSWLQKLLQHLQEFFLVGDGHAQKMGLCDAL